MFVGHYAAAYAAKAVRPALPLWLLFVAVQLVDFGWAVLIVLGIERARIEPGFTEASMLDLYHMPYTHSLVGALIWSAAFGLLYLAARRGAGTMTSAVILAATVFSHWLADLLVHVPDLPLVYGEPKLGLGLWRHFWASQALEIGFLAAALIWYVRVTRPNGPWGRIAPWLLFAVLLAVQAFSHVPPPELPTMNMFAIRAFVVFALFAFLAWLTERTRSPRPRSAA